MAVLQVHIIVVANRAFKFLPRPSLIVLAQTLVIHGTDVAVSCNFATHCRVACSCNRTVASVAIAINTSTLLAIIGCIILAKATLQGHIVTSVPRVAIIKITKELFILHNCTDIFYQGCTIVCHGVALTIFTHLGSIIEYFFAGAKTATHDDAIGTIMPYATGIRVRYPNVVLIGTGIATA